MLLKKIIAIDVLEIIIISAKRGRKKNINYNSDKTRKKKSLRKHYVCISSHIHTCAQDISHEQIFWPTITKRLVITNFQQFPYPSPIIEHMMYIFFGKHIIYSIVNIISLISLCVSLLTKHFDVSFPILTKSWIFPQLNALLYMKISK